MGFRRGCIGESGKGQVELNMENLNTSTSD